MRIFQSVQWLIASALLVSPVLRADAAMIAGSEFLADWNLILFDDLDSRARIEGKAFVGGKADYRYSDPKEGWRDKAGDEDMKTGDDKSGEKPEDYTVDVHEQREHLLTAARGLSENLRSLAATAELSVEKDVLRISGTGKASVFDLSLEDLDRIGEIRLDIPDGSTVTLNVSGRSGTISSAINSEGLGKDTQLIWNFYEAEDLRLTSDFYGTVLSPYADVRNDRAVEGTLVASSLDQRGELRMGGAHQQDVTPVGPVSVAPEPASWLMMIFGFGLIGGMLRRYRPTQRYGWPEPHAPA
ncbi:MAG: choice-of-anchor A family protein [Pseudomonadota bacterium]